MRCGDGTRTRMWSGRRGSNPRPTAWEAVTLPLSYSRPVVTPDFSRRRGRLPGPRLDTRRRAGRNRRAVACQARSSASVSPFSCRSACVAAMSSQQRRPARLRLVGRLVSRLRRAVFARLGVLAILGSHPGTAVHLRHRLCRPSRRRSSRRRRPSCRAWHARGGLRGVGSLVRRVIDSGGTGGGHLVHGAAAAVSRRRQVPVVWAAAASGRNRAQVSGRMNRVIAMMTVTRAQTAPTTMAPGAAESRTPGPSDFGSPARDRRALAVDRQPRMIASTSSRRFSMISGVRPSRFSRSSGSVFEARTLKCQSSNSTEMPSSL